LQKKYKEFQRSRKQETCDFYINGGGKKTYSKYKDISICTSKEIIQESITNDFECPSTDNFAFNFKLNDDQITFINYTHKYCIAIIDIVNSTKITENFPNSEQIRKYYSTFLNTMASTIKRYNGKVIKNAGDCLIYYFPKTVNIINSSSNNNDKKSTFDFTTKTKTETTTITPTTSFTKYNKYNNNIKISKESAFENVIKCGLAMIQANSILNENLHRNDLPSISYKISANYGLVELATSTNSNGVDLFGPTVNICSKINHLALPNQMVIHKDLYDVIKELTFFNEYRFEEVENYKNNFYNKEKSVYSVNSTNKEVIKENSSIVSLIKGDSHYKEYPQQVTNNSNSNNNQIQRKNSKSQKHDKLDNSLFNILLIDDNEDILFLFTSILDGEDYTTTSISNPVKALNYFSQIDPYYYDLIVMDVRMPGINGIQLYSKIKIMNPDIKVLFLSALDGVEELLSIFPEVKRNQIINKTINLDEFILRIKETITI
jgi:two-component system response regulator ChvI